MFKKAKQKIVISILSILCAVLAATLVMIYAASYFSGTAQNHMVLEKRSEMIVNDDPRKPGIKEGPEKVGNILKPGGEPAFEKGNNRGAKRIEQNLMVGIFYAVKLEADGRCVVLENGADGMYTDDELINLAQKLQGSEKGREKNLLYLVTQKDGATYVCFMDNLVFSDSFKRLFLFTLLFGLIALIPITFLSIHIANRIISPMEKTYQKQKQFTADAGHELKTPIAAVAANIELLQREIGENKWLDNISYENRRMKELVTELLELARNENKTIERKPTDLSRLINGAVLPLEASAFEKNVLIETEIPKGITANVDETGISQLINILLDNAISHTLCENGGAGVVKITLYNDRENVVLKVSNPGEAIPEADRENLFERFYRADSSRKYSGHYGLGLAIAKAITDVHMGDIKVECEENMITFSVILPIR